MTDNEFLSKVEELKAGYRIWQNIVEQYRLAGRDYVIAFPHQNDPVNERGIAHLKQFMEYGEAKEKKILVLCTENNMAELLCLNPDNDTIRIKALKNLEMKELITLYSISTISSHFIMMSLTEPYGRYGDKALKKGLTLDEAVTIGIYGMTQNEVFIKHKPVEER